MKSRWWEYTIKTRKYANPGPAYVEVRISGGGAPGTGDEETIADLIESIVMDVGSWVDAGCPDEMP